MTAEPMYMPVQSQPKNHRPARLRAEVVMKAYEVYCHLYGKQEAMVTGGCRGGFCTGEIIAFLYAHSFPKAEWDIRVSEALHGINV